MGNKCVAVNFAATTTGAPLTDTEVSVSVIDASVFPTLEDGQYFYATLFGVTGDAHEIIKVLEINLNLDTLSSVERGQDGTTAREWGPASKIELRNTQAQVLEMQVFMHDSEEAAMEAAQQDDFLHYAVDETLC